MKIILTEKQLKFVLNEQTSDEPEEECVSAFKNGFIEAKNWWLNWINNKTTLSKFCKNYGITEDEGKMWFEKYKKALNETVLNFPNKRRFTSEWGGKSAQAFILKGDTNNIIYCNCSYYSEWKQINIINTLIHELQHILHKIKPINPEEKISKVFEPSSTDNKSQNFGDVKKFFEGGKLNVEKIVSIDDVKTYWSARHKYYIEQGFTNDNYWCNLNEKMSNIASMRKLFGLSPEDKITYEMIEPYLYVKKVNADIEFFLLCWTEKGFPDINQMLNRTNELAMDSNKNSQEINPST